MTRARTKSLSFRSLSIQQKLPLLIFILLVCIIVTFTMIAYIGVKKAAIKTSHERLSAITDQLSSLFGQSAQTTVAASVTTAATEPIKRALLSGGNEQRIEATEALEKLGQDRMSVQVTLMDTNYRQVLQVIKDTMRSQVNFDSLFSDEFVKKNLNKTGNLYLIKDSMYYPIIVPVTNDKQLIGYLVRWRLQYSTAKAIEQFSQLLGTDATLYIGNTDGSLWTDMAKTIPGPPVDTGRTRSFYEYRNQQNKKVIAAIRPIPRTSWTILVEFSQQKIVEFPLQFLRWMIISGIILIVIALLITWFISRRITRPLRKLTTAASSIAAGDYSIEIETRRKDELGKLAISFNEMTKQVRNSHETLEKKVQERTEQLEDSNKELEAFSYSVSHDLRAPLRAVNGYAQILKEEYAQKMDNEANRLADKIISNAKKMGQLIDDLIAFSQTGGKEVKYREVDMKELATSCTAELLQYEPPGKYTLQINDLPPCRGDENLLKQVWMNLISNAIKYSSGQASPHIEIGCKAGPVIHIYYIRDNGVGFDMQYAHKLFGVFQRLHSPKEFEGSGIGLAFVKRIINKHGGEIRAEAAIGKGATFYFSLPK